MTTTYATERNTVGGLFATWTDCPVLGPNEPDSQLPGGELPKPTNDRTNPARWIDYDFTYNVAEQIVFSGGARVDGYVAVSVWMEGGVGDSKLRSMRESLRTLFLAGDATGLQFFEPIAEPPTVEGDWYVSLLLVPFTRITDA